MNTPTSPFEKQSAITLQNLGSFFFGGSVTTDQTGDSFHVDHGYAQFVIPQMKLN